VIVESDDVKQEVKQQTKQEVKKIKKNISKENDNSLDLGEFVKIK
jgi:transcription initiation factor IIE alpha subunit